MRAVALLTLCMGEAAALQALPLLRLDRTYTAVRAASPTSDEDHGAFRVHPLHSAAVHAKSCAPRAGSPRASIIAGPEWLSLLPPLVTLVASVALRQARAILASEHGFMERAAARPPAPLGSKGCLTTGARCRGNTATPHLQVILAMLLGVWSGALLLQAGVPLPLMPLTSLLRVFDTYLCGAFVSAEHAGVILFTSLLGGTIGLVQRSGGAVGLANLVKPLFTSRRRGLVSTAALGSLVFFDDYSSILIVGNSLRPLIAAVRISRAKLAFISHAVGVCLASLSPVSSWVGLQLGYLAATYEQLGALGGAGAAFGQADPFVGFLTTLPVRYFPLSMLAYVAIVAATATDHGPMAAEEANAARAADALEARAAAAGGVAASVSIDLADAEQPGASLGPTDPRPGTPLRSRNALIPFSTVVVVAACGMLVQGATAVAALPAAIRPPLTLVTALRYADSVTALVWGSAAGWLASLGLCLSQRLLSVDEAMQAWVGGIKDVLEPTIVLLLAWALGHVIADVGTATFLARALQAGLPAWGLAALVSLLSYVISFACGSSFGTMGILFPLVGPLALAVGGGDFAFVHRCFGAVMGGSLLGNVCSPISDTTILASLATRTPVDAHVKMSTPYVALAGLVALVFGDLAVGLGAYPPLAAIGVCTGVLYVAHKWLTRRQAALDARARAVPSS